MNHTKKDNPFASPNIRSDDRKSMLRQSLWDRDFRYRVYFVLTLVVMVVANFIPLVNTWKAYGTDGMETIGYPFVIFERGGISYRENFYPRYFLADIVIAIAVAFVTAHLLRNGWRALFHRLRTWGLDDIYGP